MIAFLDGFLQVGDTVGRRCTDVKDSPKGLVLVTDDEEQTIHRVGDRKLERTRGYENPISICHRSPNMAKKIHQIPERYFSSKFTYNI